MIAPPALLTLLWIACAWHPPPEPPRMSAVYGQVRQLPMDPDGIGWLAARAGWAMDPAGREGTADIAARLIAQQGAELVSLGAERVLFSVAPEHAGAVAAWISDPVITPEALLQARTSLPALSCEDIAEAALDRLLMSGHPYAGPPWGRDTARATITPVELRNFILARYVKDGIAVEGLDGHLWDRLPATLSQPQTPAPLPAPMAGEATSLAGEAALWVVIPAAPASCEAVASYAEPALRDWEPIRLAWHQEVGYGGDLRLQRPIRMVGQNAAIQRRISEGFSVASYQTALDSARLLLPRLERLLLDLPDPERPPVDAAEADRLNALLRGWLHGGPRLRVVVSKDATPWIGPGGTPGPGVAGIVTTEELYR